MAKDTARPWLQLSSASIQMGITLYAMVWLGNYLDTYYNTQKPWFKMGLILFGLIASIYLLLHTVKKINKEQK